MIQEYCHVGAQVDHPCGVVRGACGHRLPVSIDGLGDQPFDDRPRDRLCRGRHAARRLSVARHHRGIPARPARQRVSDKTLGLAGLVLMAASGLALSHAGDLYFALAARLVGGVGATIVILVATKMVADWFDTSEIVLAMSLLQMSWPFGAMIALPIQTW